MIRYRTVHYIAGPGIGYRIVKNGKDPYIPSYFPTIPSAYDPDFVNAAVPASFSPDDTGSDDVFKSKLVSKSFEGLNCTACRFVTFLSILLESL